VTPEGPANPDHAGILWTAATGQGLSHAVLPAHRVPDQAAPGLGASPRPQPHRHCPRSVVCLLAQWAPVCGKKKASCLVNTVLSLNQRHAVAHQILIHTQLLLKEVFFQGGEAPDGRHIPLRRGQEKDATCWCHEGATRGIRSSSLLRRVLAVGGMRGGRFPPSLGETRGWRSAGSKVHAACPSRGLRALWLLVLRRRSGRFVGIWVDMEKIAPDVEELWEEQEKITIHISCALACLSCTVPPQRRLFHGDTFPRFVLTNPEEKFKLPQSIAALFASGLICTVLGPAGIFLALFTRCFRLPRRSQVLWESVPRVLLETASPRLGSLLGGLDQLPRGLALLGYMAKSQSTRVHAAGWHWWKRSKARSVRRLGELHQRDREWRRGWADGQPLLGLGESLHLRCPSKHGWLGQLVARSTSIITQQVTGSTDSPKFSKTDPQGKREETAPALLVWVPSRRKLRVKVSESLICAWYPGSPIPNSSRSLLGDQTCSDGVPPRRGSAPGMHPKQDSSEGSQPPSPGREDKWMHPVSSDHDEATFFIYRAEEFESWRLGNCFPLPGPLSRRRNHPRHWEQMSLSQLALHRSFTGSAGLLDADNISAPGRKASGRRTWSLCSSKVVPAASI